MLLYTYIIHTQYNNSIQLAISLFIFLNSLVIQYINFNKIVGNLIRRKNI